MSAPTGQAGAAGGAAPLASVRQVELRDLVALAAEQAGAGMVALVERLPGLPDAERKRALLAHLHATRQRLQRLHAVVSWSNKARAAKECALILQEAAAHSAALSHAADQLFHLHGELAFSAAPTYDVATALAVLGGGGGIEGPGSRLLPRVVEHSLQLPPPERSERERRGALARMDRLLRSKLLAEELPPGLRVLRVEGGQAHVAAAGGQYVARLSLAPAPADDVVLARYRPEAERQAAEAEAAGEQPEVATQPQGWEAPAAGGGGAEAGPSTAAARAAAAGPGGGGGGGVPREADRWRWQLMTLELLPALEAGRDPRLVPQAHSVWLRQHVQERMMLAADVAQLQRLGKGSWVVMPPAPGAAGGQRSARAGSRAAGGRTPSASGHEPSVSVGPAASGPADGSGAAAGQQQQQQQQQQAKEEDKGIDGLPGWASRPLLLMHSALCQAAARVALYNLLLPQARELAAGSWGLGGSVKVERPEGGGGIRRAAALACMGSTAPGALLSYWHHAAWITHAELEALRSGTPARGALLASAAARPPPAVNVLLAEGGGALCGAASPSLLDPHSGSEASLPVDLSSASCSAEQLLLAAAALNAATQLAGLQAVMQRDARLAAARASVELVLPGADSSGGDRGGAGRPAQWQLASPLLQVWWRGEVQLGVSVQLRTARLLLAPGPGALDSAFGGSAGGSPGTAAALLEPAQAQLDRLARDVFGWPLPAGSTRGMQAASLAAGVVADLLLSLAMRQRLESVASAGAAAGLTRSSLPRALLQQHLRGMAAPALVPPLGEASLLLSLPPFPAPRDMQRQAARAAATAGSGGSPPSCGAVACHLLVDLGGGGGGGGGGSGGGVAAAGAGNEGAGRQPRVALVVCATTSRGTATRVLSVVEVPGSVHGVGGQEQQQQQQQQQQEAPQLARRGSKVAATRKRSRKDFAAAEAANGLAEEQQQEQQEQQGAAAVGAAVGEALDMSALAAWAQWQSAWEMLLAQCAMRKLPFAEELQLGGGARGGGCPVPAAAAWSARLANHPGLLKLEEWTGAHPEVDAHGRPEVTLRLDVGVGTAGGGGASDVARPGGWSMEVRSSYLRSLPVLCERAGAAAAPLPAHMLPAEGGAVFRYDLRQGASALTALADLLALIRLHTCLTRIWDVMTPSPGGRQNGQGPCMAYVLPGCGRVTLTEIGVAHLVLAVSPPPSSGDVLTTAPLPPLRVTVRWVGRFADDAPQQATAALAASSTGDTSQRQQQQHRQQRERRRDELVCSLSSEPPLPATITAALAARLEEGNERAFLDGCCTAGHTAAAVQAHLLSSEAQRLAGLIPGALMLEDVANQPDEPPRAVGHSGSGAAQQPAPAYALCCRLQQDGRALRLRLQFAEAGYVLVHLVPLAAMATAALPAWLNALWDRLLQLPGTKAVQVAGGAAGSGKQHSRAAWVYCEALSGALSSVLLAIAME